MAASIVKHFTRGNYCIREIKHLQLCPVSSKFANQTVLKDVFRSSWYSSFFRSDQTKSSNNKITDHQDSPDIAPTKPKRPPNVFLLFTQSIQDEILRAHPGFNRREIIKEATRRWSELDPETRSRLSLERKALYDKFKEDETYYLENRTSEQINMEKMEKVKKEMKKIKKARRDLGMPGKPCTAFSQFLSENFPKRSHESVQVFFKGLKEKWNWMPEDEKNVYYEKSRVSQEQYKQDMARWEESMIEAGRFDVIRKKTLTKLKQAEREWEKNKDT